jgi:hypothetical protein
MRCNHVAVGEWRPGRQSAASAPDLRHSGTPHTHHGVQRCGPSTLRQSITSMMRPSWRTRRELVKNGHTSDVRAPNGRGVTDMLGLTNLELNTK